MEKTGLPQTKAERDAFFDKILAGVKPAESKPTSLLSVLKPFRRQIIGKRREGFSLRQIGDAIKASALAIDASPSTLKAVVSGPAARRRAKAKKLAAQRAANLAAAKAAATPATASATAAAQSPRKV